ncbi:hypothetical protein [Streptosporangium sp. NBC_01756]|uniref:hypothetical protein n=1 Tax=Streptosporangium sp. NBC_01756 TaxID=2975950 RepID=UPI002DDBCD7D|nr:hypothetical protein [Streptosporangium sp. NBC_01756]WSC85205.1 hypothetical protein OIE48_33350 [Streptosporangium sp. NBC_01756]
MAGNTPKRAADLAEPAPAPKVNSESAVTGRGPRRREQEQQVSPVPQEPEEPLRGAGSARGRIPEDGGEPTEPNSVAAAAVRAALDRAAADRAIADQAIADPAVADRAVADPAVGGDGGRGGPRAGPTAWRRRLLDAAAATALAAAATVAVLQWTTADRLAEEEAERGAVFARAREFSMALQTYDYSDLQAYRDQILAISDADFEKVYDEAFGPLESVITSMKANSSASVRGVYVAEVTRGRAKAITVVDSQVTSTAGTRRMLGTYLELGLVKAGGQWKINDATVMGTADELVTDPQGRTVEPAATPSPNSTEQDE